MKSAKKSVGAILACLASVGLIFGAPIASAHDRADIKWSISVGSPYPPAVYAPPPVVYAQPRVVYMPPPVYVEPAPVVEYRAYPPQPYYVEEVRYQRWRHDRHHHRHWDGR